MAYTDDDNESENSEHPITLEFQDNFESLQTDITHIVLRQQAIQLHLTSLDSTVARIETFLQQTSPSNVKAVASGQTTSPTAKTHLYNALNRSLELIAKFNDSYNKLLELKLRYRQEQDNLQYKIVRMINLELKKTDELGEVTQDHIMKVVKLLILKILMTMKCKGKLQNV